MNKKLLVALPFVAVLLAFAGFASFTAFFNSTMKVEGPPDALEMLSLKNNGFDPSKPQLLQFRFYMPSHEAGLRIGEKLKADGYAVQVAKGSKTGDSFGVHAEKTMVPVESELAALRTRFDAMIAADKGKYDGWSAIKR
jgi:hypothetical protein